MEEEDEQEEPEGSVVVLQVRLEDEVELVEVGDPLGEMVELHLGGKQDHHQEAAQTCRDRHRTSGLAPGNRVLHQLVGSALTVLILVSMNSSGRIHSHNICASSR